MKSIIALVTLYNPDCKVIRNINQLSSQVSSVVLSDNTPNKDNAVMFKDIKNVLYFPNYENLGLSSAFNKCLKLEISRKSDYLIFFDQDSLIPNNYIEKLVSDFDYISSNLKVGILGPQYFDINKNKIVELPSKNKNIGKDFFEVSEVITSSMITKYEILEEVDFWNDSVFLDYADFDLCWRLKEKGFSICQDTNILLNHTLGKNSKSMFLPIKNKHILQSYWIPIRYYYQTRESVKLFWKRYVPRQWKKNFFIHNTVEILMHLYYLPQKRNRLKYFFKGFIDGMLRKNGEYK